MKTLYMLAGLPASGKSTWAKAKMAEHPGGYKRTSKDDLRAMVDNGKWSQNNEKFILGIRDHIIGAALNAGQHVIVDDTNLAPKHQERLKQLAKQHGAAFEVVDFTHVTVEECIARDQKRANYVGEAVIRDMWKRYLALAPAAPIERDANLPDCIIVDVDGTLALMNGRGPFDWARVGEDHPNQPVHDLLAALNNPDQWIFVSGRAELCRGETERWLNKHLGVCAPLFMRETGDSRDDRIVKREIYEREIKGKFNVMCILDDRQKVVTMWRSLGLPCFQVAEGDF